MRCECEMKEGCSVMGGGDKCVSVCVCVCYMKLAKLYPCMVVMMVAENLW